MTLRSVAHVGHDMGEQNFKDLVEIYFDGTGAAESERQLLRILDGKRKLNLGVALRHHASRPITSETELQLRDGLDDLLSFYSILEIACTLGYVNKLAGDVLGRALRVLGEESVLEFYQTHYPLLLPDLFRQRAADERTVVLDATQVKLSGFLRFLDLNAALEGSRNADDFLALVDDYWLGYGDDSVGFEDLLDVLGKPKVFFRRLRRPSEQQDNLDSALHGFRLFLGFCQGFDQLLASLEPFPVQQSSLWHYHAYWFDGLRDQAGAQLLNCLHRIDEWAVADVNTDDAQTSAEHAENSVENARCAIRRLTSGRYGWVLRESYDLR